MDICMRKSEEFIAKIYPVLFSDDFELGANTTGSACGSKQHLTLRKDLIFSALRFGEKKGGA